MSAFGGGGLFGANNNAQQQQAQPAQQPGQSGGIFGGLGGSGGTNTNTGGGGLFGAQNQAQGSTGTGGLFGGNQNQQQNQQQQQGTTGGLFGSATGQSSTGGDLFGANNASTQPAAGGLFGNNNANTGQPATGGGLFGANNNTQPAQTGGLFGSTNQQQQQPATGGGLFGSNTSNNQPAGGLFGSTNNNAQPSTGGGLFGSTTAQPATSGLFGSTNNSQPAQGGGLFGSTAGASTSNAPGTGGLFGGNSTTANAGSSQGPLFGSTAPGLFASKSTASTPAQQHVDAQAQFTQLQGRIERIVASWNPSSAQNRFQHYFYNLVDPSQVHLYGKPIIPHDEALWQRAVRENPDPSCRVPVLATSFDDLQKRVDAQSQQSSAHQEKLGELRQRLAGLSDAHALKNAPRLAAAANAQAQLARRLLALVQHLHLLIPALRASALSPEEEALRAKLEEAEEALRTGRVVGRMNELWALLGTLKAARGAAQTQWAVVDEDGLARLVQILREQQAGLAHVTSIVKQAQRDVRVIYGVEEVEETGKESDLMQSFSQTLRGSTIR
ncbi:hypothetical protein PENSPDRAFT_692653 [Peniophora sp. CONT]|nr:hypothetical protein PENSPDRAFT_692653 [Peniophora sp. CONT]